MLYNVKFWNDCLVSILMMLGASDISPRIWSLPKTRRKLIVWMGHWRTHPSRFLGGIMKSVSLAARNMDWRTPSCVQWWTIAWRSQAEQRVLDVTVAYERACARARSAYKGCSPSISRRLGPYVDVALFIIIASSYRWPLCICCHYFYRTDAESIVRADEDDSQ